MRLLIIGPQTEKKISKALISKTIQSSGSFGSWLANLGKKTLINVSTIFSALKFQICIVFFAA